MSDARRNVTLYSRIKNRKSPLKAREVYRQSPTGLIFSNYNYNIILHVMCNFIFLL